MIPPLPDSQQRGSACQKSLAEFRAPQARKRCRSFFPAACTSGKIHSGLQVCRLSAFGGQLVRAAGHGLLSKNSKGVFRQPQNRRRPAVLWVRETLNNEASADSRRFCHRRKFEKCGNTGCLSHFSNCTDGAKDSLFSRSRIVQRSLRIRSGFTAAGRRTQAPCRLHCPRTWRSSSGSGRPDPWPWLPTRKRRRRCRAGRGSWWRRRQARSEPRS